MIKKNAFLKIFCKLFNTNRYFLILCTQIPGFILALNTHEGINIHPDILIKEI
jgi:hypothetical protein